MKINTTNIILLLLALALFTVAAVVFFKPTSNVEGAAFPGSYSYLQVATTTALTAATPATVLPANTYCKARVLSTLGDSAVMVLFGDQSALGDLSSSTMSGSKGHWQAASTTVAYDSEVYGCGKLIVRSFAATTVTVTEF